MKEDKENMLSRCIGTAQYTQEYVRIVPCFKFYKPIPNPDPIFMYATCKAFWHNCTPSLRLKIIIGVRDVRVAGGKVYIIMYILGGIGSFDSLEVCSTPGACTF